MMVPALRLLRIRTLCCRGFASKNGLPYGQWSLSKKALNDAGTTSNANTTSDDRTTIEDDSAPPARSDIAATRVGSATDVSAHDHPTPQDKQTQQHHAVFVDGFSIIYRSYYATFKQAPMINDAGQHVNALNGFCRTLFNLMKRFDSATHFAVMLDSGGGSSHRAALYPDYKAHRKPTPDDLKSQLPLIEQFLKVAGIPVLKSKGWEADDIIATYTEVAAREEANVTVISGDKDLYQIVSPTVQVYSPYKNGAGGGKGLLVTEKQVIEHFGVPPEQVVQVQALAGDAADNIPGVRGVGPKTAGKLICEFGSLEAALSAAHDAEIKMAPKLRERLQGGAEIARTSLELVKLRTDSPLEVPFQDLRCSQRSYRWQEHTQSWLMDKGLYALVRSARIV